MGQSTELGYWAEVSPAASSKGQQRLRQKKRADFNIRGAVPNIRSKGHLEIIDRSYGSLEEFTRWSGRQQEAKAFKVVNKSTAGCHGWRTLVWPANSRHRVWRVQSFLCPEEFTVNWETTLCDFYTHILICLQINKWNNFRYW